MTKGQAAFEEKVSLLKVVKQVLPIGPDDWKMVEQKYNRLQTINAAKNGTDPVLRLANTLEKQFDRLTQKKKPKVTSAQSSLIDEARRLEELIQSKIHSVTAGATDDEADDAEEENCEGSDFDESESDDSESFVAGNRFRTFGEALGDDFPRPSKTTPVPRYRRKQNQPPLDSMESSLISLVDIMKEQLTSQRDHEQHSSSGDSYAARIEKLEDKVTSMKDNVDKLSSMMQLLMEKLGLATPSSQPSKDEEDEEESHKRQRLE